MPSELTLSTLAKRIARAHAKVLENASHTLLAAKAAGELLRQAKDQVPHGQWLPWLEEHFPASSRTASDYMLVAERWEEVQQIGNGAADLSLRETVKLLSKPKAVPEPVVVEPAEPVESPGPCPHGGEHDWHTTGDGHCECRRCHEPGGDADDEEDEWAPEEPGEANGPGRIIAAPKPEPFIPDHCPYDYVGCPVPGPPDDLYDDLYDDADDEEDSFATVVQNAIQKLMLAWRKPPAVVAAVLEGIAARIREGT